MNSRLLTGAMTVGLSLSGAHDAAADEPTTNDGFSAALKLNVLNGESTPPAPATQPPLSDAILAEMRAQLTSMFAGEVSADADPTKGVVVGKEAGACAYVDRDLRTSGAKEVPTIYKDAVRSTAAIAAGQAVCAEQNPVFAEADTKRELLNIDRVKMVTIT
ncbi:hypothetical protein KBD59_04030, partial [Candidatus Gracilibacteria bacterium]|nr:hypothetical protein [Candidatus Gracilibacteria bacterium]